MNSKRIDAQAACRELQERYDGIKQMEEILCELTQLFNDVVRFKAFMHLIFA
jgi:t-SNARE complex subunit (syntaxin)